MHSPMKTFLVTSNACMHITDLSADDKNDSSSTYNIDMVCLDTVVKLVRTSVVK